MNEKKPSYEEKLSMTTYDYFGLVICLAILFLVLLKWDNNGEPEQPIETPKAEAVVVDENKEEIILEAKPTNIITVEKVIDGDTILGKTKAGEIKVRLASIDAPESSQFYGDESKQYLADLIQGKAVRVEDYGLDKYNRTIATIFLDNVDINEKMVADGYAWYLPLYANGNNYLKEEIEAREGNKGQWKYKRGLIPPTIYRKLKTLGEFGKSVYDYGFYLDKDGVLHNKLCPNQVRPNQRWNGYDSYINCNTCGGCFVE